MVTKLVIGLWRALPSGRPSDPTWNSRHRTIVLVLVGHVIGLPIYGIAHGFSPAAAILHTAPLVFVLAVAWADQLNRRLRAAAATLGLVGSSAILVDFSHGAVEAHFHFFVMLFVITLYQDWLTFLLAVAFVFGEHALAGVLKPDAVYGHSAAAHEPVKYALIHATYVAGAAVAAIANWRLTDRAEAAERGLRDQLAYEVSHDPLTGALNRRAFEDKITTALEYTATAGTSTLVCVLDLDRFKIVNDTCGHPAGDRLLIEVYGLLSEVLGPDDVLARLGGDEFGILLERPMLTDAMAIPEAACAALLSHRYQVGQRTFSTSASIGVLPLTSQVKYVEEAMQMTDAACYAAKESGRGRVHLHQQGDAELAKRHNDSVWAGALLDALRENRLELVYQPIVPTAGVPVDEGDVRSPRYGEILVRLRDIDGSMISPGLFFPAAERYDLLPALDRRVVSRALEMLGAAYPPGSPTDEDMFTINLAGPSIGEESFLAFVRQQFAEHQLPPRLVCFEITETVAITNLEVARNFITELRGLGCQFALDDFGSGLSSFAYLKSLDVDFLKIDGRFVQTITRDSIDRTMVAAVNEIGHEMGLRTIAEFVEDDAILAVLREIGVDYGQGYGLGKPRPLVGWLSERRPKLTRGTPSPAGVG